MFTYPLYTSFFFFNDTATTEIYTLSLHDALPISFRPRVIHEHRTLRPFDLRLLVADSCELSAVGQGRVGDVIIRRVFEGLPDVKEHVGVLGFDERIESGIVPEQALAAGFAAVQHA